MHSSANRLINPSAEFLSIKEVGKLFSPPISHVSLWKWQKEGKLNLNPYLFGNKKFYKREEVLEEIEHHKMNTIAPLPTSKNNISNINKPNYE
jgi:hypothetical protein